jgi:hypothetical protein
LTATPSRQLRLAIMQPYLFPYLGYWQLLSAVDRFVVLDDVNYINRGWINRNRVAVNGSPVWLTVPLQGASQNRLICDIDIVADNGWKGKMMRMMTTAYARAPQAEPALQLFGDWLAGAGGNLSAALVDSLRRVAAALEIDVDIVATSRHHARNGLTGQDRILDICRRESATTYVNLPGGRALYDPAAFRDADIELTFLEPDLHIDHLRSGGGDGAVLSILDSMMYNSRSALAAAVRQFGLQPA